jgi:hypothetical protein
LLECALDVSLRAQFGKTAPLHGNSDVPQSIPLKLLMEALKHLETLKKVAIVGLLLPAPIARRRLLDRRGL